MNNNNINHGGNSVQGQLGELHLYCLNESVMLALPLPVLSPVTRVNFIRKAIQLCSNFSKLPQF